MKIYVNPSWPPVFGSTNPESYTGKVTIIDYFTAAAISHYGGTLDFKVCELKCSACNLYREYDFRMRIRQDGEKWVLGTFTPKSGWVEAPLHWWMVGWRAEGFCGDADEWRVRFALKCKKP
jgi:hypothetical protein